MLRTTAICSKAIVQRAQLSQLVFSPRPGAGRGLIVARCLQHPLIWEHLSDLSRLLSGSCPPSANPCVLCCLPFNHLHILPSVCPSHLCTPCPSAFCTACMSTTTASMQLRAQYCSGDTHCTSSRYDSAMHGIKQLHDIEVKTKECLHRMPAPNVSNCTKCQHLHLSSGLMSLLMFPQAY